MKLLLVLVCAALFMTAAFSSRGREVHDNPTPN
jgi:hypothetical protein